MLLVSQALERVKVEEENVESEHRIILCTVACVRASLQRNTARGLVLPGVPAIKAAR
jgi:hypothetical protein